MPLSHTNDVQYCLNRDKSILFYNKSLILSKYDSWLAFLTDFFQKAKEAGGAILYTQLYSQQEMWKTYYDQNIGESDLIIKDF